MERGYIKLWRKIDESQHYHSEPFDKIHAWIDLLIMANHKDRIVNIRGIMVQVKRGQILAGEEFLAERWHWSRGKVRRYIQFLSKTVQQIEHQKSNICSMVSIVNYDLYQDNGTPNRTADGTTDGQQTVQQTDTPKNDKNVKKISTGRVFIPPTLQEVKDYCIERKSPVDPQIFWDKGESNGWVDKNGNRYKDWKAVVRTWEGWSRKRGDHSGLDNLTETQRRDLDKMNQLAAERLAKRADR